MENDLRDDLLQQVLSTEKNHIVLEVATGVGKSKIAIGKIRQLYKPQSKILIVIPRNVLIQNWKDEFVKWGCGNFLPNVTFTTYVSLPKHAGTWDMAVFDEAHHLSERCQDALKEFHISHCLFLSATLKREHKRFISRYCRYDVEYIRITTQKAIENEVLPDPKILLVPLNLDNKYAKYLYCSKKVPASFKGHVMTVPYKDKWNYRNFKSPYRLQCTQKQYYDELSSLINWYKHRNFNPAVKNMWLHKCGERLQWLSSIKLGMTKRIISALCNRYVVFCNTIDESEKLGIPAVNSKMGFDNLDKFNRGEINGIVAVNCLNEGINLKNCQVGVFNAINSSEIMQIQKAGRLLRHQHPFIIIPYYRHTREEEIVDKWMKDYNPVLIYKLRNADALNNVTSIIMI